MNKILPMFPKKKWKGKYAPSPPHHQHNKEPGRNLIDIFLGLAGTQWREIRPIKTKNVAQRLPKQLPNFHKVQKTTL